MVVVDTLTKVANFLPVQSTFGTAQVANLFMKEIMKLHGIPKMIMCEKNKKFTSAFWKTMFGGMGTKLNFSTTYHPKIDGKTKKIIHILEDML